MIEPGLLLAAGDVSHFAYDLTVVLVAGFLAGLVCRRLKASLLIGYLLVGTLIGTGALGLVEAGAVELAHLAELGVLLLLFTIGLELSLEELIRLRRHLLVGGLIQMLMVIAPVAVVFALSAGDGPLPWKAAILVGVAVSFSSTVLVFQALHETGEGATAHGRRAMAVLLFQDVAVVPILLLIPLLSDQGAASDWLDYVQLVGVTTAFVAGVLFLRWAIRRYLVELLAGLRSPALVVMFTISLLGAVIYVSDLVGLPISLGAFAAGLMLSGNRISAQIDALILPFREVFAAVFFVSLGLLLDVRIVASAPLATLGGLAGVLVLKSVMGAVALRATGLTWRTAAGMGLGIAQVGEFALVVMGVGVTAGVLSANTSQIVLFIAVASLVLTPFMLRRGIAMAEPMPENSEAGPALVPSKGRAVLVGIGVIGRGVTEQLVKQGLDVCLIDLSPVNLHEHAAAGLATVAGNAADTNTLERAGVEHAVFVVITVPSDAVAMRVLAAVRDVNATCEVIVRCRYRGTAAEARRQNATVVIEEDMTLERVLALCEHAS